MSAQEQGYDAIVVGAGPGGSAAAAILGDAGKRTLLLDRHSFPREKICGDGITFKCFSALDRLGILDAFFQAVQFHTRGYSLIFSDLSELTVRCPIAAKEKSAVYVLPRFDFDRLVLGAALGKPAVEFIPEVWAQQLLVESGQVVGVKGKRHGKPFVANAPLVIDACGANTALATQMGAGNHNPRQCALAIRGYFADVQGLSDVIELYFDKEILPGYFWIFPTSATTANIGCGTFAHLVQERSIDLRAMLRRFIDTHPVASKKLKDAQLCGKFQGGKIPLALDSDASRVRHGLMMVGDAASFTDPITAEGISYALWSGVLAGEAGAEALHRDDCSPESLAAYDFRWKEAFGSQFARAAVLTAPLGKEVFADYLSQSFQGNASVSAAVGSVESQYELMAKLKVLLKAL